MYSPCPYTFYIRFFYSQNSTTNRSLFLLEIESLYSRYISTYSQLPASKSVWHPTIIMPSIPKNSSERCKVMVLFVFAMEGLANGLVLTMETSVVRISLLLGKFSTWNKSIEVLQIVENLLFITRFSCCWVFVLFCPLRMSGVLGSVERETMVHWKLSLSVRYSK